MWEVCGLLDLELRTNAYEPPKPTALYTVFDLETYPETAIFLFEGFIMSAFQDVVEKNLMAGDGQYMRDYRILLFAFQIEEVC